MWFNLILFLFDNNNLDKDKDNFNNNNKIIIIRKRIMKYLFNINKYKEISILNNK